MSVQPKITITKKIHDTTVRQTGHRRRQPQRLWPPMFDPLSCRAGIPSRDDVSPRVVLMRCHFVGWKVVLVMMPLIQKWSGSWLKPSCNNKNSRKKNTQRCPNYMEPDYNLAAAINIWPMASGHAQSPRPTTTDFYKLWGWNTPFVKRRQNLIASHGYKAKATAGV